jgi:hypothetical protein
MKLSVLPFLFMLCLLATPLVAQKKKEKPDVEIIDFGDTKSKKVEKDRNTHNMIVKTSTTSFIFGWQPIELERQLTDYLSIQAGAGFVFKSFIDEALLGEELELITDKSYCESDLWRNDECDDYNDMSIRSGGNGLLLSLSPRLFIDNDGYEGSYIAPVVRWSTRSYQVQEAGGNANRGELMRLDSRQREQVRNLDILVNYGYQTLFPVLSLEFFIGAGVRLQNATRQDVGIDNLGFYRNGERTINDTKLRFDLGIRVGFQL